MLGAHFVHVDHEGQLGRLEDWGECGGDHLRGVAQNRHDRAVGQLQVQPPLAVVGVEDQSGHDLQQAEHFDLKKTGISVQV